MRAKTAVVAMLLVATPALAFLGFNNFLQVSPFLDGNNWFLTQPLVYHVPRTEAVITVPVGFQTDFASVPRPFWSLLPPWGSYGPAAVVHDFLYWDQQCTREEADAVILLAMTESDVGRVDRWVIYHAVHWGGALAWKGNTKARSSGRERVMPALPTDPNTTWSAYQRSIYDSGHRPEPRPTEAPKPDYCRQAAQAWSTYLASQ